MMGLPGQERSLTISSAVWIQSANVADDGQTPDDSELDEDRADQYRREVKSMNSYRAKSPEGASILNLLSRTKLCYFLVIDTSVCSQSRCDDVNAYLFVKLLNFDATILYILPRIYRFFV